MSKKSKLRATAYRSNWKNGLTPRALELLGKDVKVEGYAAFLIGRHNELCGLKKYSLPDGCVYYDAVQVELSETSGPRYLMALKDENGDWVEESRWTEDEIQEVIEYVNDICKEDLRKRWNTDSVLVTRDPEIEPDIIY
ncbi:hypothetical protein MYX07_07175 [Patescibacteria group bacterium AH-259-L07]|nr:hypothetical protein [Patescibacteria group bacterium AH-259-L07]